MWKEAMCPRAQENREESEHRNARRHISWPSQLPDRRAEPLRGQFCSEAPHSDTPYRSGLSPLQGENSRERERRPDRRQRHAFRPLIGYGWFLSCQSNGTPSPDRSQEHWGWCTNYQLSISRLRAYPRICAR